MKSGIRDERAQPGGTFVPFCTPSMVHPLCHHIDALLLDGPEKLLQLAQLGAVTSVAEAAWQDLLACGKADDLVPEPGN